MYRPAFCVDILDHFNVEPTREVERYNPKTDTHYMVTVPNHLPTLASFARTIKVDTRTLWMWGKAHPDFYHATTRAKAMAEAILVSNALEGHYNPQFSVFVAKNYTDMRDVKDLNIHQDEVPLKSTQEVLEGIEARKEQIKILEAQL